jgi:AraC family transcriptional regulator
MADPVERVVLDTRRVTVGEWRCARGHPLFADSGPIQRHLIAFPRTAVVIRHEGKRPFVADPSVATVYNPGQRYRREPLHPGGDQCDWWGVDAETAAEIAATVDRRIGSGDEQLLPMDRAPVTGPLYLRQRELLTLLRGGAIEPLGAEEAVLALFHDTIAAGVEDRRGGAAVDSRARDIAHGASSELARSWHEQLTLDVLSQRVGVSAFHLCRVFRAVTGRTLHRQLTSLRLRASLEALAGGGDDLTEVALDHGFSSHSHFTAAFRREYGLTPSAWREAVRARAAPRRG